MFTKKNIFYMLRKLITEDTEFIVNQNSILERVLNESEDYIPRFSLKDIEFFNDIPVNEPVKYTKDVMIKAIKNGLIFLINYKGAKDKHFAGHERVIYPMVLGLSAKRKPLLRGYHLSGWSVSKNTTINKIWRLFRTDRILSMTFTGSFFRIAPDGYKKDDKGMRGGIIANADFDEIRRNQEKLLKTQKIQSREDVSLEQDKGKIPNIIVENTDTELDIEKFMDNPIVSDVDDLDNLRVSFLRSSFGNNYIAILGAIGKPGNIVKLKEGNKTIGNFKVLDSAVGRELKKIKKVRGNTIYSLYKFIEKK